MMKYRILLSCASIMLLSGCETLQTPQQRREANARQQAATRHAEERVYRVQGQVESVEMENARLVQEVQQLQQEVRSFNSQIAQLNSKVSSLEAKQSREMNDLVKRVEGLLKKAASARPQPYPSGGHGPGREHVVESGHTLSAIASAYGTTVKAIKQANNLKSDNIYVGQKLFIPE